MQLTHDLLVSDLPLFVLNNTAQYILIDAQGAT